MAIRVVLEVADNAALATLLATVDGTATLIEASLIPTAAKKATHKRRYNGRQGITGKDLLFSLIKDGPQTEGTLENRFATEGFAKSSVGPLLSTESKKGTVVWDPISRICQLPLPTKPK